MKRKPQQPWLACDEKALALLYPEREDWLLARVFGRSEASIVGKAHKMGLRKSEAYLERYRRRTCFQKGLVPWNKGKKVGSRPGMEATQFKRGNKPHTWKPVGSTRVNADGCLDRKVSDTGNPPRDWQPVHRLVWIAANGPIPEGHVVRFKPGKRTTVEADITVDVLELITQRENMARNTVHNLPKPLVQVIQLRGALNRRIKARSKKP